MPTALNVTRENPWSAFHSKLVSSDIFGSKSQEKSTFSVVVSPRLIYSSARKINLDTNGVPESRDFFPLSEKKCKIYEGDKKNVKAISPLASAWFYIRLL